MNFDLLNKGGAAALIVVLFGGCKMIPTYEQPEIPVAATWQEDSLNPADAAPQMDWRDFYTDPTLRQFVETALQNNRDLRVAGLNVDRMEALFGIQKLALIPNLDLTGSDSRTRTPADLSYGGFASTGSTYRVGLQMPAFELDFFGRVRSLKEQALETYLATQEAELCYQSSLVASVASQYYTILANNSQLALSKRALEASEKNLNLVQAIYESGAGTELDVRTAEGQVHSLRASVAALNQQIAQTKNTMVLLLGTAMPTALESGLPMDVSGTKLPAGLPSDLLTRRPDIRAAEHILLAANANIGVARAAFFPRIELTAFGGTASSALEGLFEDGSGMWSFVPSIKLPIFAGGQNKATLEMAEIEKRVEIANYEKAIQTAFKEVSDGLAVQANIDLQIQELESRFKAADRRYSLSKQRYEGGVDSYLTVLQSEQERISAEQSLLQAKLSKLVNQSRLFSVLGLQSNG